MLKFRLFLIPLCIALLFSACGVSSVTEDTASRLDTFSSDGLWTDSSTDFYPSATEDSGDFEPSDPISSLVSQKPSTDEDVTDSSDIASSDWETESSSVVSDTDITTDSDSVGSKTDLPVSSDSEPKVDPLQAITGGVLPTAVLSSKLMATSVCTLRNLPVGKAVQRFFIVALEGEINIFTTQRSGTTLYLSRCRYNPERKLAVCLDYLALPEYGHGESLEVCVREGKIYVYTTSKANTGSSLAWGTEVTRFVYNKGKKSEEKSLTDFHCATKNGAALHKDATPYRINFSLDEESDLFLAYVRCDTNYSLNSLSHYFVSYRLSDLDRMLDAADRSVSLKSAASALVVNYGKVSYKEICPNGSFQGMDLSSDGETVYVSGGTTGEQPGVCRSKLTDKAVVPEVLSEIVEIYANRIGMDKEYMATLKTLPEIESIQLFNGRFYVSFNPGSGFRKDNTEIFVLSPAK